MFIPIPLAVASREILWNVNTLANVVLMYSFFALSVLIGGAGILRRAELWSSGKATNFPPTPALERLAYFIRWAVLQHGTNRERTPAFFHSLIYIGFLVLLFTTTMVFIDHDLGIKIYHGDFYLLVTIFSDMFGIGLFFGILVAGHRRVIQRKEKLHTISADFIFLIALALLVLQGFCLEGLRILVTNDPWRHYSPIGNLFALSFWGLSPNSAAALHYGIWWFHSLTVFLMVALVPYTKFFHIIASSANLYFRPLNREKGRLETVGDIQALIEKGEEISLGLGSIKDYSWKHLLDLDACTSCGRCQEVCPAYISGKPLSPKWLILDTRNHMLALHAKGELSKSVLPAVLVDIDREFVGAFQLPTQTAVKEQRGSNKLVQEAVREIGGSAEARIASDVMDPDVFWSCTTCMACIEACPVGINHVDQIVGNRRNMALMHGEVPSEAQTTLRALENRKNPYGPPETRIKWAEGLELKILQPGDSVDYLYWVGCVSSFDARKQKIAQALVKIMNQAGLSFGILGNSEGCSGDPARRLGEENLYQTLAKSNIDILKTVKFKTIVANCPHCFNTIRNEYPEFGNLGEGKRPEIIHHSVLLQRLIAENRITLKEGSEQVTFHDPCYLGRYNDEYDAPRDVLRGAKGLKIIEMEKSREKGMCCGAGGGHFWMDIKKGTRVNSLRVDQAAETGAKTIATACPFCMQMMEDGVKLTNREAMLTVKDIAEVVAEKLN
jgi:Fe-S oxidoreductase/nitrate reductase gamma subunit